MSKVKNITGYATVVKEKSVGKGQKQTLSAKTSYPEETMAETDGTTVKVAMSFTKNLGNYESAKLDFGIEYPTTVDKIEETKKAASEIVTDWLKQGLTELNDASK